MWVPRIHTIILFAQIIFEILGRFVEGDNVCLNVLPWNLPNTKIEHCAADGCVVLNHCARNFDELLSGDWRVFFCCLSEMS